MQKKQLGNEEWEMGADRFGEERSGNVGEARVQICPTAGGAGLIFLKPIWRLSNPNSSFCSILRHDHWHLLTVKMVIRSVCTVLTAADVPSQSQSSTRFHKRPRTSCESSAWGLLEPRLRRRPYVHSLASCRVDTWS